jgi:L-rhamnose isomerase / sugar isomerase
MQIEKNKIIGDNSKLLAQHKRKFHAVSCDISNIEEVMQKLSAFQIAIPSWGLQTGGTQFGSFIGGGEPRNLEQKIEDVGLLHQLNQSAGAISLHIPWDTPSNANGIKALAAQHGLVFDAMNSNTFQDLSGQQLSYKFGSLQHVDSAIRKQAIEHNFEVIKIGIELGSKALTVWLADGSCFPGQLNFRKAFQNTYESLQKIYSELPDDWKLFVEYKPFGPNFYSMTVGDWSQSLLYTTKLGPKASTLVDLSHHLPNANIEQIVSLLLMEGKLGGFHFNDSKYGDDHLTAGCIRPYQLFLIFCELVEGMDARAMNHATGLAWMIDASHNVKDPIEDLLQSIEAIMIAYTQALLVDGIKLNDAKENNDVVAAQELLQNAFRIDVRAIIAEVRLRKGGVLNPLQFFREHKIREQLIKERSAKTFSTVL